jgi:hypothetical protein
MIFSKMYYEFQPQLVIPKYPRSTIIAIAGVAEDSSAAFNVSLLGPFVG